MLYEYPIGKYQTRSNKWNEWVNGSNLRENIYIYIYINRYKESLVTLMREREKGSLSLLSEESSNTGNTKQQKTGTDYRDQRTIVNGVCNVHHLISSNGPDLASLYTIWIYDCIQLVEMSEIALPQGFVKFWECIAYFLVNE